MNGTKSKVYNPYHDGAAACIWELFRRNPNAPNFPYASSPRTGAKTPPEVLRLLIEAACYFERPGKLNFKKSLSLNWSELDPDLRLKMDSAYFGDDSFSSHNPFIVGIDELLKMDDEMLRTHLNSLSREGIALIGVYPSAFDSDSRKTFEARMWALLYNGSTRTDVRVAVEKTFKKHNPDLDQKELRRLVTQTVAEDTDGGSIEFKPKLENKSLGSEKQWEAFAWNEYLKNNAPVLKRIPAAGKRLIEVIRRTHKFSGLPDNDVEITSRIVRTDENIARIAQLIKGLVF